jgi:photosystem II stability/assembly factor-like uncharacterized protein
MFNSLRVSEDRGANAQHLGWDKFWRLGEVRFIDEDTGWAAGHLHRIALTSDGGVTWTEQRAEYAGEAGVAWNGIDFKVDGLGLGTANGVVVGSPTVVSSAVVSPPILYTTNGGQSCGWTAPTTLPSGTESMTFNDVTCSGTGTSGNEFWAVGAGVILYSQDAGDNWELISQPETGIEWNGVAFKQPDIGFFVGKKNGQGIAYLLSYADSSSRSWGSALPICWRTSPTGSCEGTPPVLRDVACWNSQVFAVGNGGSVLRYTGAGIFDAVNDAIGLTDRNLLGVQVLPDDSGSFEVFICGNSGVMINRHKEGSMPAVWSRILSRTNTTLSGISFPSFDLGWAIGGDGPATGAQTTVVKYE